MNLPKFCALIGFVLCFNSAQAQEMDNSRSMKWLNLLEDDWPDFEREDSKTAANELVLELKNEIRENNEYVGHYNYMLCEMYYYLKEYDSSIVYGRKALETHFTNSVFVYQNLSFSQQKKIDVENTKKSEMEELRSALLMLDTVLNRIDSPKKISVDEYHQIEQSIYKIERITGIKSTGNHDHLGLKEFIQSDYTKWLVWYIERRK